MGNTDGALGFNFESSSSIQAHSGQSEPRTEHVAAVDEIFDCDLCI